MQKNDQVNATIRYIHGRGVLACICIFACVLSGCKSTHLGFLTRSSGTTRSGSVSTGPPTKSDESINSSTIDNSPEVCGISERSRNRLQRGGIGSELRLASLDAESIGEQSSDSAPQASAENRAPEVLPTPDGIVPLTLNQVIYASLDGHPVIGRELERIEQSRADFLTSTLLPNPELFTDIQLLPLTRPFTVDRQGGPPQQDVILTYPIDWFLFGKRAAQMSSAHYGVHVTEAEFENLVRLRVVEAAVAYFDATEARGLREVAETNVENLRRIERVTQSAVENGGRPAIEVKRVQLDLLAAEQTLRSARATEQAANAALLAIMGRESGSVLVAPEDSLQLGSPVTPLSVEMAVDEATRLRPDLRAIQWQVAQANAEIDVQQRLARPSIAPSFGYTHQYQQKAIGFPDADSWSAALTMSVPLYDRNQGNISKAVSAQRQVNFAYQATLLSVRAEIAKAVAELDAARQNAIAVETQQLELADGVRKSIEESYENGGRPLIDVLDAQRNYRETYALFVKARAEYWRAIYRYYAAIGQQVTGHD